MRAALALPRAASSSAKADKDKAEPHDASLDEFRSPAMLQWMAMLRESFEGDHADGRRDAGVLHALFQSGARRLRK